MLRSNEHIKDNYTSIKNEFVYLILRIDKKELIKYINRIYKCYG